MDSGGHLVQKYMKIEDYLIGDFPSFDIIASQLNDL